MLAFRSLFLASTYVFLTCQKFAGCTLFIALLGRRYLSLALLSPAAFLTKTLKQLQLLYSLPQITTSSVFCHFIRGKHCAGFPVVGNFKSTWFLVTVFVISFVMSFAVRVDINQVLITV